MSIGRARKQTHSLRFSWKGFLKAFTLALLFFASIFYFTHIRNNEYFPIHAVKVYGVQHVNPQEVQTLIEPLVSKGFFAVDVERIRELISQLPWAAQVTVRRMWPDRVVIVINEKNPVALWNDSSLLSASGELFSPTTATYPAGLPQLAGPAGEQLMMAQYYAKMNSVLAPLHSKIARLELTPAMTWSLTLDNGMKLNVGHKDILTRLDHFVKVYPKIVGTRVADVEYVDLRYPNGMAVRWKSVT
jgi:cell division protein FtsQ